MDNSGSISIGLATPKDIQGILAIQEENQPEHGGQLSVRMSKEWFEKALSENSVIVARDQGLAIGYIVSTSIAAQAHIPIVQAMLKACPSREAYIHGPVCVAKSHRNRGLAKALFHEQCKHREAQEALTFIREDNEVSRRAHASMGMREIVEFDHDKVRYIALKFKA
jgi:predicted N-acetyltransferase YhbS